MIDDSIYKALKTRALGPLVQREEPEPFSTSQCVRGVSLYCLKPISQVSTILFHNICQAWILLFFGIPYSTHFNSFNNGSIVVYSDWVSLFCNISITFNHNWHSTMMAKVVPFHQCSECKKNLLTRSCDELLAPFNQHLSSTYLEKWLSCILYSISLPDIWKNDFLTSFI